MTDMSKQSSFLQTLVAVIAVTVPIAGVAYFIGESRFVDKDEYHQATVEQVQVNQQITTATKQLDKRLDETNVHLKNLNMVLDKIQVAASEKPRRRGR